MTFPIALFVISASFLTAATFVVVPDTQLPGEAQYVESYAFSTTSEPLIAEIRVRIASGRRVSPYFRYAAGADGITACGYFDSWLAADPWCLAINTWSTVDISR